MTKIVKAVQLNSIISKVIKLSECKVKLKNEERMIIKWIRRI